MLKQFSTDKPPTKIPNQKQGVKMDEMQIYLEIGSQIKTKKEAIVIPLSKAPKLMKIIRLLRKGVKCSAD